MNLNPVLLGNILTHLGKNKDIVLFIYDLSLHKFLYLSEAYKIIWGRKTETLDKDPASFVDTVYAEDRQHLVDNYATISNCNESLSVEFRIVLPDKSLKWIGMKVISNNDGDNNCFAFGFAEDITVEKEHNLYIHDVKERKDAVLQILGHDLRGPLNNIEMSVSLLEKDHASQKYERTAVFTKLIHETCTNALKLINDVLDFEFIETAKVQFVPVRIDLVSKVNTLFETYELIRSTNKKFVLKADKEKVYATVDEMKFLLVVENLISNAYKFTAEEGTITVEIQEKGNSILLKVQDDGIGIPEDMQPLLFDKFTKARRPGIHGENPIGLGLNIVKQMVETHKGKIWFESQENKGTTFFVEIPQ